MIDTPDRDPCYICDGVNRVIFRCIDCDRTVCIQHCVAVFRDLDGDGRIDAKAWCCQACLEPDDSIEGYGAT